MVNKSVINCRLQYTFLSFLVLLITVSCNQSIEPKINTSIQNLIKKYPQLTADKNTAKTREFSFTRSVREGEFNTEIRLYSQPQYYKNRNQILVLINGKNEIYTIPLFNSKYRDYWEFPFDTLIPKVPKINTTFSKEFNLAIDKLINNNDRSKSLKRLNLIHESFYSLLDCQIIQAKDSIEILKTLRMNSDIPDESTQSAQMRLRRNYDLMKLSEQSESIYRNCYFDKQNARIHQVEYHGNKIKIKSYRMDYGMHFIYL
ncbi:hypothetical protein [Flavobacterium panacagri]|uniref:hypothetical protein n=1 Tax=Flavobacterium panacagri TaxID=3034146 RepID=UPI0025A570A5|nr:hypothetical protein [Flavobacterium panacagri]